MSATTFLIDNHPTQKVILKGDYKLKIFKKRDPGINGDGTVFLAKKCYNVNMFHHGTLLHRDNSKEYINELIKSINESNSDFTHSNGQFTKSSNDGQKIFTVYNRYTFGYDTLNVVALKSTIKDIVITNSCPRCGDHQYALKIVDKATSILDVFGLYW